MSAQTIPFLISLPVLAEPEEQFVMPDALGQIHPLCLLAAKDLQQYLRTQNDWYHNFGLTKGAEGPVIGKMFGVLVVRTPDGHSGYLAAFSGKLAGGNQHKRFVPPVFDALTAGSFLNTGMAELTTINHKIKILHALEEHSDTIISLKLRRRAHSIALQRELFRHYRFLNKAGTEQDLLSLFEKAGYRNPPAGAGECAGPKLLQFAFRHQLQPVALAEFWWGQSPKSDQWQHGRFYPCCREKCAPILAHMLQGIDD